MKSVEKKGVAPEDFYSTTIYRTQVRVNGEWLDVDKQRMDAVIAYTTGGVYCKLIRDLKKGDKVVTGCAGLRVLGRFSQKESHEMFGFMSSSISSERRVELTIERIGWEMSRIRFNKGRIVVVAGPVVIHTGGSAHLAWMVRNGYVSALLGGNAIAAHDIEQSELVI